MPTLEEMRAEINRLLPDVQTPQFVKNIQTAYQNMPGAAIPQAALSLGSNIIGAPLGAAYGVARNLLSDKFGTQEGIQYGQQEAKKVMDAMRYTPPTKAGREIVEGIETLPQKITGSHMGFGMLPEIWGMPPRISPSDVQVMGARGINAAREIGDIPRDFSAAQSGLTRLNAYNEPTYGARMQNVAQDIGDVMARRQAMRSEEGAPTLSGFGTFTDLVPDPRMYAVKPKGGNWPTTLGSTAPLKEQGLIGTRLTRDQLQDKELEIERLFEEQLEKYDKENGTRLKSYYGQKYWDEPSKGPTKLDRINSFIYDTNEGFKGTDQPLLPTLDRIQKSIPVFNQWVMGPYQKYMRNQMATGLSTDPLLQVINEANIPLSRLFRSNDELDINKHTAEAEERRLLAIEQLERSGVDPTQPQFQDVGRVTATTPVGEQYENVLDYDIALGTPRQYGPVTFPFASKLDPKSTVYDVTFSRPRSQSGFKDIKSNVLEGLISGKYDPEKISNLAPSVVVQDMIKDYQNKLKEQQKNEELMETYRVERAKQLQTDSDFPDGSKMVVFNKASYDADPDILKRDFGQITKDLNQCIGAGCHGTRDYPGHGPALEPHTGRPPSGATGELSYQSYYDMVKDGNGEIISLVDPNSKYQFTIQAKYDRRPLTRNEEKTIAESWILQHAPDYLSKFQEYVNDSGDFYGIGMALREYPEIKDVIKEAQVVKKNITQMRGADNGEVAPAYEQHVTNWLNQNADVINRVSDLEQIPGILDLTDRSSYVIDKLTDYQPDWNFDTLEKFLETVKNEKLLPRFFGAYDIENLANERKIDLTEAPPRELSPFEKESIVDEFDRFILNKPDSLHAVNNFNQENNLNLLLGNPIRYDLPVDIHRKLVKMILSDNQSLINSVADKIKDYTIASAVAGGLEVPIPFGLTSSQATNIFNILNGWYNKNPRKDSGIWGGFEDDAQRHPNPFDEVKLKEFLARPDNFDLIKRDLDLFFQREERPGTYDVPQVNEDIAILMGNQEPEAKIPLEMHMRLVKALLNQDDNSRVIRNSLSKLNNGEEIHGLNGAQRANVFNMLSQWVERYPLNDIEPEGEQQLRPVAAPRQEDALVNVIRDMEPEPAQQLPFDRPEFPGPLGQNMRDYFDGYAHNAPENMIEPYATETRILMGSQRPEARLPIGVHRVIVEALLDQDNRTNIIRQAINGLQLGNTVNGIALTPPQAENALNILIDWTERYPLNE